MGKLWKALVVAHRVVTGGEGWYSAWKAFSDELGPDLPSIAGWVFATVSVLSTLAADLTWVGVLVLGFCAFVAGRQLVIQARGDNSKTDEKLTSIQMTENRVVELEKMVKDFSYRQSLSMDKIQEYIDTVEHRFSELIHTISKHHTSIDRLEEFILSEERRKKMLKIMETLKSIRDRIDNNTLRDPGIERQQLYHTAKKIEELFGVDDIQTSMQKVHQITSNEIKEGLVPEIEVNRTNLRREHSILINKIEELERDAEIEDARARSALSEGGRVSAKIISRAAIGGTPLP